MLIVICVKFHHDRTSASLKTNLTKNFNLRMEWTNRQTDGRTEGHNLKLTQFFKQ